MLNLFQSLFSELIFFFLIQRFLHIWKILTHYISNNFLLTFDVITSIKVAFEELDILSLKNDLTLFQESLLYETWLMFSLM